MVGGYVGVLHVELRTTADCRASDRGVQRGSHAGWALGVDSREPRRTARQPGLGGRCARGNRSEARARGHRHRPPVSAAHPAFAAARATNRGAGHGTAPPSRQPAVAGPVCCSAGNNRQLIGRQPDPVVSDGRATPGRTERIASTGAWLSAGSQPRETAAAGRSGPLGEAPPDDRVGVEIEIARPHDGTPADRQLAEAVECPTGGARRRGPKGARSRSRSTTSPFVSVSRTR